MSGVLEVPRAAAPAPGEVPLPHLLAALRERVARQVEAQRMRDPDPNDPYRGLYVADHHVDEILGGRRAMRDGPFILGATGCRPLDDLARRALLDPTDISVLVAALAPDLDPDFERLYVYLNDDITRRRSSVGVALRLAGADPAEGAARARLLTGAPLVDLGLVEVEDAERPFLTRGLRVPDRVLQHLLRQSALPLELAALVLRSVADHPDGAHLARALADGDGLVHLEDPSELGGIELACAALAAAGMPALCVDLSRSGGNGVDPLVIVREAVLRGAGLVLAGAERASPDLLRGLVEHVPAVVVVSREPWDPAVSDRVAVSVPARAAPASARRESWRAALGERADQLDLAALDALRLSPTAVVRTVDAAGRLAAADGVPLGIQQLLTAAQMQGSPRLGHLARRIRPGVSWDDLIVQPSTHADLALLVARVRHAARVLDGWGLRRRSGHAEGVTALFAGGSGTGKTLAAEVVGRELGLDLYVIDLSTVVDKYVGETEKNLDRIFAEAEGINGILFFDEADALFGKRSEVSDARDRYANTEISYLLQRIERFDGLAVLATNLRANVDEAFLRRLSVVVDFPDPDAGLRRRLWRLHLGSVPAVGEIDVDFLAGAFRLSGGNIRNVTLTAAFMAAADERIIAMADVVRAVALEYRKLGRLCDESEFGRWAHVLDDPGARTPQRDRPAVA